MLYNPLFLHFLRGILNAINRNLEGIKMAVSNIKAIFENDIHKVWDIVFGREELSEASVFPVRKPFLSLAVSSKDRKSVV